MNELCGFEWAKQVRKIYSYICIVQFILPVSINKEEALKRIDSIIKYVGEEINKILEHQKKNSLYKGERDIRVLSKLCLRIKQTIIDLTSSSSQYRKFAELVGPPFNLKSLGELRGALESLREDYVNDFLTGINEMINADLFSDILEQAEYLLSQNFVRASAVVAGVALESHLRKLSEKNSIFLNDGKYVKADSLNGQLYSKNIIDKIFNKSVTSWLGLRNEAAHQEINTLNEELVDSMISGIRIFIEKYPA